MAGKNHVRSLGETSGVCKGLRKTAISTCACLRSIVYCLSQKKKWVAVISEQEESENGWR